MGIKSVRKIRKEFLMRQPLVNRIVRLFEALFFTTNIILTCLEIFLDISRTCHFICCSEKKMLLQFFG